jgi:flagellar motor protein MotB
LNNKRNTNINYRSLIIILVLGLFIFPQIAICQYFKVDTTKRVDWLLNNSFLRTENSRIKIKNIHYSGEKVSLGNFGYKGYYNVLPTDGIIIGTGSVIEAEGPNRTNVSTENYSNGDVDIERIVNNKSFDAAKIEFDFMSLTDSISFTFVFASEEYPEYVKKGVSDAFAFIITDAETGNSTNLAKLPNSNTPITIDLINRDINKNYYIDNTHLNFAVRDYTTDELKFHTEIKQLFEFDGFTKPISTGLKLKPFCLYHFKIVIADVGDRKYDSWVLLKGNSFVSCGIIRNPTKQEMIEYLRHFSNDTLNLIENNDVLSLIMPIYFDFDSEILKIEYYPILNHIVTLLSSSNFNLTINGFADKVGEANYNQKLSQKRADKVKDYLVTKGIERNRLNAVGKGVLSNNTNDISRKVEFVFL